MVPGPLAWETTGLYMAALAVQAVVLALAVLAAEQVFLPHVYLHLIRIVSDVRLQNGLIRGEFAVRITL